MGASLSALQISRHQRDQLEGLVRKRNAKAGLVMRAQMVLMAADGLSMRCDLVLDALLQALETRPANGAIFHSDRGSQYGSTPFRKALAKAGLRQSMSTRANPYDNAWTESFIGTLKLEMLQDGCFENAGDAQTEIFDYIEGYYNTHRKHSAIGYKTPSQFEAQIHSAN